MLIILLVSSFEAVGPGVIWEVLITYFPNGVGRKIQSYPSCTCASFGSLQNKLVSSPDLVVIVVEAEPAWESFHIVKIGFSRQGGLYYRGLWLAIRYILCFQYISDTETFPIVDTSNIVLTFFFFFISFQTCGLSYLAVSTKETRPYYLIECNRKCNRNRRCLLPSIN